ncbi:hypothetical protein G5B35_06275 [Parapusillimonas sp. SGNA-6]|jgi:hypothetical protein|nr:hypothetical protein [Parapusillimonas sp. SGNA-6]
MPVSHAGTTAHTDAPVRRFSLKRMAGGVALAAVLALAFIGYLTPDMQVQWANFMSLCGF